MSRIFKNTFLFLLISFSLQVFSFAAEGSAVKAVDVKGNRTVSSLTILAKVKTQPATLPQANGSRILRCAPLGNTANCVSVVPKAMLILARVLIAQPLASKIGDKLR